MLKLILVILTLAFYTLRDPLCYFFFPNLKLDAGDWDGANAFTMNVYSAIVFFSAIISFLKTKYFITTYFQIVTLLLCISDVIDRSIGLNEFYQIDKAFIIPICFLLPSFYYLLKYARTQRNRFNQ